jgi:DNA-binding Lrp family transcriptional regulator
MTNFPIDRADRRLLVALQRDASQTAQQLGEGLEMSASQAGRRKQRLESEQIIRGYQANLDPQKLGLSVQALVQVEMRLHNVEQAALFRALITDMPEVTSAWTLTGDADYVLRVFCTDLHALNHLIHHVLLAHQGVARVKSQIVMDQLKDDAPLPL